MIRLFNGRSRSPVAAAGVSDVQHSTLSLSCHLCFADVDRVLYNRLVRKSVWGLCCVLPLWNGDPRIESENTLDYVRNAATTRIWRDDPWLVSVQDARLAHDGAVSKFAEQLPDNYRVADLRSRKVGSGFSWGKAGPRADIRRNGAELVFGVEQKAPGFFSRILSRRS